MNRAALEAFGGAYSPCLGGNPWFGDVFEWVLEKDPKGVESLEQARMEEIDRTAIHRLEAIRSAHPSNPLVAIVSHAFSYERSTCCQEVTTFSDWWRGLDTYVPAANLKSESWRIIQLGHELLRNFPSRNIEEYDAIMSSVRRSLVRESVQCPAIERVSRGRLQEYRVRDDCALDIGSTSMVGMEIKRLCPAEDLGSAGTVSRP